jgi:hypothetical protein
MPVEALIDRLTALSEGDESVDLRSVVGEFRRSAVMVPVVDDSLLSVDGEGVRWIFAFTSEATLADFALMRGLDDEIAFVRMRGARLLDVVVPAVEGPAGVALDAGSGRGLLLPPAHGVVPEEAVLAITGETG